MLAAVLIPLALQAAAPCPALPAELAGWATTSPATDGRLIVGKAADVMLFPIAGVRFRVPPTKAAVAGSFAAGIDLTITAAGRYRVALGAPAWIDMVRDGAMIASIAHTHGDVCTGVGKIVDFDLKPGRYLVELSGAARPVARIMVARLP